MVRTLVSTIQCTLYITTDRVLRPSSNNVGGVFSIVSRIGVSKSQSKLASLGFDVNDVMVQSLRLPKTLARLRKTFVK